MLLGNTRRIFIPEGKERSGQSNIQRHYANGNKPITKGQILYTQIQIHLHEIPRAVKFLETESRMNGRWVGDEDPEAGTRSWWIVV